MTRLLIATATLGLLLAGSAVAEKPAKLPAAPRNGVRTPGAQIPFANLVAEAEEALPAAPAWLAFAGSLYAPSGDGLVKIDSKTNKAAEPIAGVAKPCSGLVSAFGSLWAAACGNGTLVRIDAKTSKITATIASGVGSGPRGLAASADSIWLLTDDKTTLSRIDPDTNTVVGDIRLPVGCQGLSLAEKSLWIACPGRNKVLRINAATNVLEAAIVVSAQPVAIAGGTEGAIWVLCRKEGKLDRIDAKTNKVTKSIELGTPGAAGSLAFGEGWLWVTQTGFPLARIDAKLETVVQQFYGAGGGGSIVTSPGAVWLSTASGVKRIDPKRVIATLAAE